MEGPADGEYLGNDVLGMSTTSIDEFLTSGMLGNGNEGGLAAATRPHAASQAGIFGLESRRYESDQNVSFPSRWSELTPDAFRVEVGPQKSRGEDMPMQNYGAATDFSEVPDRPRVAGRLTSVVVLLGTACVITLAIDGGWSKGSADGIPESGSKFGCKEFLCPHSGECWHSSSQCPEGNPFWQENSAYNRLAQCGQLIRGTQDLPNHCKMPVVVLRRWGLTQSDGCLAFLCPRSGACVAAPHVCPEGNPFTNATSLYWRQALATERGSWEETNHRGPSSGGTPGLGSIATIKVPPAGGGDEGGDAGRNGHMILRDHAASQRLNRLIRRSQAGGGEAQGAPGSLYSR